ncbi:expressed protein [Echinococcus multilocularis]|uniref:Expressed protein n=1 Tax=Echinococcus multilocularis TaxID=6211 RepID=A0A068XZM1_ECHMU|nr:expressed protein [Echinococcus multilocularis]
MTDGLNRHRFSRRTDRTVKKTAFEVRSQTRTNKQTGGSIRMSSSGGSNNRAGEDMHKEGSKASAQIGG